MDIERTIEFLLEQQAASQARFDAQMAEVGAKLDRVAANQERADGEIRAIRSELRRAVRLAVQEARAERRKRRDADEKLAASQEDLRQSMKAYFDSLRNRTNGHDKQ